MVIRRGAAQCLGRQASPPRGAATRSAPGLANRPLSRWFRRRGRRPSALPPGGARGAARHTRRWHRGSACGRRSPADATTAPDLRVTASSKLPSKPRSNTPSCPQKQAIAGWPTRPKPCGPGQPIVLAFLATWGAREILIEWVRCGDPYRAKALAVCPVGHGPLR